MLVGAFMHGSVALGGRQLRFSGKALHTRIIRLEESLRRDGVILRHHPSGYEFRQFGCRLKLLVPGALRDNCHEAWYWTLLLARGLQPRCKFLLFFATHGCHVVSREAGALQLLHRGRLPCMTNTTRGKLQCWLKMLQECDFLGCVYVCMHACM